MASKALDMPVTEFPAMLSQPFESAAPPMKIGLHNIDNRKYFNDYRNEHLSKFQMFNYQWGYMYSSYLPKPDGRVEKNLGKYLRMPKPKYTMLDSERMEEIDNFYKVAQMQRAKLQDDTGAVHPMAYFKEKEYPYQCPTDLTSTYFQFPYTYTKYRDPIVYPISLGRTHRGPMLPARALTGKYSPQSDISYKK